MQFAGSAAIHQFSACREIYTFENINTSVQFAVAIIEKVGRWKGGGESKVEGVERQVLRIIFSFFFGPSLSSQSWKKYFLPFITLLQSF